MPKPDKTKNVCFFWAHLLITLTYNVLAIEIAYVSPLYRFHNNYSCTWFTVQVITVTGNGRRALGERNCDTNRPLSHRRASGRCNCLCSIPVGVLPARVIVHLYDATIFLRFPSVLFVHSVCSFPSVSSGDCLSSGGHSVWGFSNAPHQHKIYCNSSIIASKTTPA